jgi:hypothetical protein
MAGAFFGTLTTIHGRVPDGIRRDQILGNLAMKNRDGRIVETAVEARGGLLGRPVLVVLIVSTLLSIGLLTAIYLGYFAR